MVKYYINLIGTYNEINLSSRCHFFSPLKLFFKLYDILFVILAHLTRVCIESSDTGGPLTHQRHLLAVSAALDPY
jgi:hypothetical protein